MDGYVCPFCFADTDGPVGPEGCDHCQELEEEAYAQASSDYWEDYSGAVNDDPFDDLEDFEFNFEIVEI